MKNTKPPSLEKRRPVFFQLGLIVALATTLVAFEWMNYDYSETASNFKLDIEEVEIISIPPTSRKSPIVDKSIKHNQTSNIINAVDNTDKSSDDDNKPVMRDPDLVKVGGDDYDPTDDDPDDLDLDYDINKVQFKPYYESCANVLDREQQANCSYQMIRQHVANQIKYPRICLESRIQGTVWVSFIVDKEGNVEDVEVIRGKHSLMDKEAVKAVASVPKLIPAQHRGRNVAVKFKIPVKFTIPS